MSLEKSMSISSSWRFRPDERRTIALIGDLIVAVISLVIALVFWAIGDQWLGISPEFLNERVPFWFYGMPLIWLLLLLELYDTHRVSIWRETVRGIIGAAIVGVIIYLALFFAFSDPPNSLLPRRGVAAFLIAVVLLTLFWRYLFVRLFSTPQFMRRVLLVGAGETGQALLKVFKEIWPPPFFLVGLVDDDPAKREQEVAGYKVMGASADMLSLVIEHNISDVVVAISGDMRPHMFQALIDTQERGIEITRMPVMYEDLLNRVPIDYLDANWLLRSFVDDARTSRLYDLGKRLIDILGGLAGLLILALVFPVVALAILLESGRPVFYSQPRLGKGGRIYNILKFRTMWQDAEADGRARWAQVNDDRATRIGRILRKSHVDELPQFLNVLRGEMSLVGPRSERPELVSYFQEHIPFYRARLLVQPGITGWAQVNYGYASSVEQTKIKLEYDLFYIKHRTLWMDILILLRTPWTVFGLRGR